MAKSVADLIRAATSGNVQELGICIQSGVDVNVPDASGHFALTMAIINNKFEAVLYLLEHGAKTRVAQMRGCMAIELARQHSRHDMMPYLHDAHALQQTPEWSLLTPGMLAHVEGSIFHRRKLTEIFNFESRERLTIVENLRTDTEATLPPVSFDDLPESLLKKAFDQFTALGGEANENFVLYGPRRIDKKSTGILPYKGT